MGRTWRELTKGGGRKDGCLEKEKREKKGKVIRVGTKGGRVCWSKGGTAVKTLHTREESFHDGRKEGRGRHKIFGLGGRGKRGER